VTRPDAGFTLVEMAVVLAVAGLLLTGVTYTLSAQVAQRDQNETRRRLDEARELVLAFAIVSGRLPCPARATSLGDEVRDPAGECRDAAGAENYYGGLLPARSIGYQNVDADGFALDAWGNRIRYAVSKSVSGCSGSALMPHFTSAANLKANGISCLPDDLVVCKSSSGIGPSGCGPTGNALTNQNLVVAAVYSVGKNFATVGSGGPDEAANLDADAVFVNHPPAPAGALNGEFDDRLTWITVGELYGRLISAGMLP
jgi:prepilin-type N-terminal cleavage/methylation domain-containing protein